jgi:hypothetical protein
LRADGYTGPKKRRSRGFCCGKNASGGGLAILAAAEQSDASPARGEGRRVTSREETTELAEDVKRRGMARLAAEQNPR